MSGRKKPADGETRASARPEDEFAHLLRFTTLEEAEETLRRIDALWRENRAAGDPVASARAVRVLQIAREGRRRAQMIAGNQRVAPEKRREKEEIRQWFRVWLETPEAFFDWLELRKASPEFTEKFGKK